MFLRFGIFLSLPLINAFVLSILGKIILFQILTSFFIVQIFKWFVCNFWPCSSGLPSSSTQGRKWNGVPYSGSEKMWKTHLLLEIPPPSRKMMLPRSSVDETQQHLIIHKKIYFEHLGRHISSHQERLISFSSGNWGTDHEDSDTVVNVTLFYLLKIECQNVKFQV